MTSSLLKELRLLAALKKSSPSSNLASERVLLLAFQLPKPLTTTTDRAETTQVFLKSIPIFSASLQRLRIRLEPDLVDHAQRCCSGLQYIVDELELKDSAELNSLIEGPVAGVKEYIKDCKEQDIQPEYPSVSHPLSSEELSKVPKSHWWWFVTPNEDSDSE